MAGRMQKLQRLVAHAQRQIAALEHHVRNTQLHLGQLGRLRAGRLQSLLARVPQPITAKDMRNNLGVSE